jgi:hypothetical protein
LLCNDSEMGGYTRAVSGQRLGKHVPAKQTTEQCPLLGSKFSIMQQKLDYNNGRAVFSTWSVPRDYMRDKVRAYNSSVLYGSQ